MTRPVRHSGRRALLLTGGAVAALAADPAWATTVTGASATGTGSTGFEARISAPGEFAALDGPRELVMDVYFGGRRLGEARVVSERGTVRFRDPAAAAALLPQAADPARLAALLSGPLPANADRVCARLNDLACGTLETDGVAVIADEDRLRIDLFVGPALLKATANAPNGFLPAPLAGPSLASAFGLALSGTGRESPLYNLQARNVFGWGAARVRSNLGVASGFGLLVDDLAVELDRPDQRWTAGLVWAPGNAVTGERRILGASFGTQLDTRADRDGMAGSPQYLFLRQPARVEMLVNGRLVDARHYEAGNNILDTTALPSGSYDLVLRVQEGSGPVREERRFFVRSTEMAPLGRPLFHAVAGVLAATAESRPVSLQRQLYFSAGANVRLSEAFGVEAGVSGTQGKLLAQGGLFLMTRFARVHAGALGSTDGDSGALLQVASGDLGSLQFTLDARRVHSRSGQPLLPQTASGTNFGGPGAIRARPLVGSYTQLTGNASLQLGALDLTVAGYYRADGPGRDYSIGPSLSWRMMQLPGMQVTMLADAQKTAGGLAGFVGGRLVMVRGGLSTVSTGGASLKNPAGSASRRRSVGSVTAQWDVQPWEDSRLSLSGGVNREESGTGLTGGAACRAGSALPGPTLAAGLAGRPAIR
jgi:hypothetical protein